MLDLFKDSDKKKPALQSDNKTGKVLITQSSELVEIVINEKDDFKFLITIDSENLLRAWSLK